MVEKVKIRVFSYKGSETMLVTVEEAEQRVNDAVVKGYLVMDEESKEKLTELGESRNILLVPPIGGG